MLSVLNARVFNQNPSVIMSSRGNESDNCAAKSIFVCVSVLKKADIPQIRKRSR